MTGYRARVWLPRQLDRIESSTLPVVLLGGEPYGTPYLIEALRARRRLAWFALSPRLQDDPIGQANALAAALNAVLGAPLFAQALPHAAHLRTLRHHAADLRPLWIALTVADAASPLAADLLALHGDDYRIVLDVRGSALPSVWRERALVLDEARLAVTPEEAVHVVPGGLASADVDALVRGAGGRFGDLLVASARVAQLPAPTVPSPLGPLKAIQDAEAVDPGLAVRALQRTGDDVGALELAVLSLPEGVDDLLRRAGPAYQERGQTERLHLLLSAVPPPYATRERTLEWRLVAALAAGELASVAADVDAHLAAFDAPELRARRAGTLPSPTGWTLAEEAARSRRTPLTVWQLGRLHPDPVRGIVLLEESVRLAEELGTPYEVARNAGALAARLLHAGEFQRARAWAQWALHTFDQHELRDGPRRLLLANDLAYARLLIGDVAGLRRGLADTGLALDGVLPDVANLYRTTLAALDLAEGRPTAALAPLRTVVATSARRHRGEYAVSLVRVLNELGLWDEAAQVAADTVELGRDAGEHAELVGRLARGMAEAVRPHVAPGADTTTPSRSLARPHDATVDDLAEVMHARSVAAELRLSAALHYLLATGGAAHNVPSDLAETLSATHPVALHVFSGPRAVFQNVWSALDRAGPPLRLDVFGGVRCHLAGQPIALPPRLAEVALALALHPTGIGRDALNDFLVPHGQAPFTSGGLRGLLTRLRTLLPVSEAPYRLTIPYACDVQEMRDHLAAGRARDAIATFSGAPLPSSTAPGVEELRAELEEQLRQVALIGSDADVLYELAERLGDDLELWEACADALAPGDPRLALARARRRRLREEYRAREGAA